MQRTYIIEDHILSHKASLNNLKMTEIIQSMLFDHNEIKLENYSREITGKSLNTLNLKKHTFK